MTMPTLRNAALRAALLLAAALPAGLAVPGPAAEAAPTPVSFAYSDWIGFAPLFVASDKGFFGDYPLRWVHMEDGQNAALLSGAVQTTDLSMNEVIEDHTKHFDIKIVMPIDYSAGADAIVARTSVARLADLKGQTIPLDTTGYSELLLVYALNQAGLTLHDVKTVQMDASVVPAALIGKHAEVGVTWAPHIGELTAKPGFHVLYSSADAAGLITDNFSTTEKFLKAHPGAMPAIIKGYLKGRAFIADHPDEAFQLIGKRLGITPQDAADQYKLVNSPSVPEMLAMMTGTGDSKVLPYARNIELVHSVMVEQGALKPDQTVPASAMLDPQFVQAVSEGK